MEDSDVPGGARRKPGAPAPTLLCVVNFPANTGFAWTFLEGLYARIAARLVSKGVRTIVAYPRITSPPGTLEGFPAHPVELDATLSSAASRKATCAFIRQERVRVMLTVDGPPRHWSYLTLRAAGIERILVYDHGSGFRSRGSFVERPIKWLYSRLPGVAADHLIAVSDFVAGQHESAWQTPRSRLVRVWNGIDVPEAPLPPGTAAHEELGIDPARPILLCACRAMKAKGVIPLFEAFDRLLDAFPSEAPRPALLYAGDGPDLREFREVHARLRHREDIHFLGKRSDVPALLRDAALAVVPSLWQEGFGLAALEPMAIGRAVIASSAGALPEIVRHEETGLVVPPGDVESLRAALLRLLEDRALRDRLGSAGHARARSEFSLDRQVAQLTALVLDGLVLQPQTGERSSLKPAE